jgi:hypothetical protein
VSGILASLSHRESTAERYQPMPLMTGDCNEINTIQWLPLIDQTNGYDLVYNWFDLLKAKGHYING